MVWGGDGSMSWQACCEVWGLYGKPLHVARLESGEESPGWAIYQIHPAGGK
jgi:hypothetical protein